MPVNSRREVRVQLLLSEIVSTTTQSFTVNLCRHLASVTHAFKGLNASERQMRYLVEFIEGKQAPLLRLDRKMGATRNCESIYIGRRVIWRQVARTFEIEIDARLDPGCVVATTPRYQNFRRGKIRLEMDGEIPRIGRSLLFRVYTCVFARGDKVSRTLIREGIRSRVEDELFIRSSSMLSFLSSVSASVEARFASRPKNSTRPNIRLETIVGTPRRARRRVSAPC